MTKDVVAENVETAISALEKGEDVLLQEGDLVWLRQIMRDRSAAEPGDNARLNAAIESAHLTKTQRRLFEESWNGTAENRPAEPT
jgi:hypothetical protein